MFTIYRCVQVYNAYQTLLKGLASMLQVFHGIQKCDDIVDSKSSGEKSTNNDEPLDDPASNVKQILLILLLQLKQHGTNNYFPILFKSNYLSGLFGSIGTSAETGIHFAHILLLPVLYLSN